MSPLTKNLNPTYNPLLLERKNYAQVLVQKPLTLNIILLVAIFVVLIFYVIEINQIITFGFKLNELEQKQEEMKKINKTLELEKIKLESLNNTENELTSLDLVKIDKVEYLRPLSGVALTQK